jgi:hypothetical protein
MNRASTGFKLMKEVKKQLKKEENRRARVLKQAKTLQGRPALFAAAHSTAFVGLVLFVFRLSLGAGHTSRRHNFKAS